MYKSCMPPYKTFGATVVSSRSRVIFTTAARQFFFGRDATPTRLQRHQHPKARHVSDVILRVCLVEQTRALQIPLHRRHRPSPSHQLPGLPSSAPVQPLPVICDDHHTVVVERSMHDELRDHLSGCARCEAKQCRENARSKLPRLETTITQSIELALQLGNNAQSDRARGPPHHVFSSAKARWESVKNHISVRGNAHLLRLQFDVTFTSRLSTALDLKI